MDEQDIKLVKRIANKLFKKIETDGRTTVIAKGIDCFGREKDTTLGWCGCYEGDLDEEYDPTKKWFIENLVKELSSKTEKTAK